MFRNAFRVLTCLSLMLAVVAVAADPAEAKKKKKKKNRFSYHVLLQEGSDLNSAENPLIQPQDPALSGGGRDQSQQFGDILVGTRWNDLLIGRLGTDFLVAGAGDDVMVGGTEHFNPSNRDRAFGSNGDDAFLWSPGDGSDFFAGGRGHDAVFFGLMGEIDESGELVFRVSNDQQAGNVFVDPRTMLPLMDVNNSPGFCEVVDRSTPGAAAELDALGLDHLVRFVIRGIRNQFEAGERDDDNGLRVTLSLNSVEFVVCATREGGETEILDLRYSPPRAVSIEQVPSKALRIRLRQILTGDVY